MNNLASSSLQLSGQAQSSLSLSDNKPVFSLETLTDQLSIPTADKLERVRGNELLIDATKCVTYWIKVLKVACDDTRSLVANQNVIDVTKEMEHRINDLRKDYNSTSALVEREVKGANFALYGRGVNAILIEDDGQYLLQLVRESPKGSSSPSNDGLTIQSEAKRCVEELARITQDLINKPAISTISVSSSSPLQSAVERRRQLGLPKSCSDENCDLVESVNKKVKARVDDFIQSLPERVNAAREAGCYDLTIPGSLRINLSELHFLKTDKWSLNMLVVAPALVPLAGQLLVLQWVVYTNIKNRTPSPLLRSMFFKPQILSVQNEDVKRALKAIKDHGCSVWASKDENEDHYIHAVLKK